MERDTCLPWSLRELELLPGVRVVVCLGAFAWDFALRLLFPLAARPCHARARALGMAPSTLSPKKGTTDHRQVGHRRHSCRRASYRRPVAGEPPTQLLGCFHPSQQNTFTGKLTEPMIDAVLLRAREMAGL